MVKRAADYDLEHERSFNAYYAEFLPVAQDKMHRHDHPGVEFIYVVAGSLALNVGDEPYTLDAGDSIYFDSTVPHAYRRNGRASTIALVVAAP